MSTPRYFKGGSFVQNSMPRSNSTNAIPSTSHSISLKNGPKTTDDLQTKTEEDSLWGEDDDELDMLLWQATQDAETHEDIRIPSKPSPPLLKNRPNNNAFTRVINSDEKPSITPAENFNLRRQRLTEKDNCVGKTADNVFKPTGEDFQKTQEKIKALETEKESLKCETFKLKGEVSTLRRTNENLKEEMQTDIQKRLGIKEQNASADQEEIKRLQSQIEILKTDLLKASFSSPTRSKMNTSRVPSQTTLTQSMEAASVVDMSMQMEVSHTTIEEPSNSNSYSKPRDSPPIKIPKLVQTDESSFHESSLNNGKVSQSIPIVEPPTPSSQHSSSDELNWASDSFKIRELIFEKIDKIVELRYQLLLPKLELMVKQAPTEIMRKLVRNNEIKSAFPDVVDIMFEWGIDKERRKNRADANEKEPKPPILPSSLLETGRRYYEVKNGIEVSFKYGGTWGALSEVRDWLQKILKSLEGKGRFRIYQYHTLMNFWRLLFWANELWRSLLFEEENEELVMKNKKSWARELEGWTGLTLKCDWRDYFVVDLEKEVRKLTLNILKSIAIAGYFEQNPSRYVILYMIIKDVCIKDSFRDAENLKNILRIVSASIPDLFIVKHLCYKIYDGNMCLARLLGDSVLKVCREETNSKAVAQLYLEYMNLLEQLMMDKPTKCFQSKYAREINEQEDGETSARENIFNTSGSETDVADADMTIAASQFACPVKYDARFEEMMDVDTDYDELEKELCCWLNPSNYEDPLAKKDRCQCRKIMLSTAIYVLQIPLEVWRKLYLEYEIEMERIEIHEMDTLGKLQSLEVVEEDETESEQRKMEKECLANLQEKKTLINKLLSKAKRVLKKETFIQEWNWDDVINHKKEIIEDDETLPFCVMEFRRQHNVFDLAISKGLLAMSFLQSRSENLAAAIGSDAYKVYMKITPLMRLYIDQFGFNRVDRDILMEITTECDEDHLGSASISFSSQDDGQNFQPDTVTNTSLEFPIPISPLGLDLEGLEELEAEAEKEFQKLSSEHTTDDDIAILDALYLDNRTDLVMLQSGPFTYRIP